MVPIETTETSSPSTTSGKNPDSVSLAYDLSMKSYDWVLKRIDAWDGTIDKTLTWGSTVTVGFFAIVVNKFPPQGSPGASLIREQLYSPWFILAAIAFGVALFFSLKGRVLGNTWREESTMKKERQAKNKSLVILPDPKDLYAHWLKDDKITFENDMIFFAGQHFEQNKRLVSDKAKTVAISTGAFMVEAILLVIWLHQMPI